MEEKLREIERELEALEARKPRGVDICEASVLPMTKRDHENALVLWRLERKELEERYRREDERLRDFFAEEAHRIYLKIRDLES